MGRRAKYVLCPLSAPDIRDWQFCQGADAMHPDRAADLKAVGREAKKIIEETAPGKRRKEVEDTRYGPFPCAFWDGEQCAILTAAEALKKSVQARSQE